MSRTRETTDPRRSATGRTLYRWHRRVGLVAAVAMIVVAVTGIVLNHDDGLGLGDRTVSADWLLSWYGLGPPDRFVSYDLGDRWLSAVDGRLYIDGRELGETTQEIRGAAAIGDVSVVAVPEGLWLFGADGSLVEKVPVPGMGGEVIALGVGEGGAPLVETDRGRFIGDPDFVAWRKTEEKVIGQSPSPPPDVLARRLVALYRGEGLPLDRVLLDVHSGRIFGRAGPYVFDALAVALLFLSVSGLINWIGQLAAGRLSERRRSAKLHRP